MTDLVGAVLGFLGALFMLLAAVGIVRLPDLFGRLQAATKAATLGMGLVISAVAVHFWDLGVTTRAAATVAFVFLTGPVGAHMIARAAYFVGVPLWEGTLIDELRGHYDRSSHRLESVPGGAPAIPPTPRSGKDA
jgi:multicomponent Na+:H+ antiporter subunit G